MAKAVSVAVGIVLFGLGALANYTDRFIFAAHWKVYLRFPWMPLKQYFCTEHPLGFALILAGVPLAALGFGLLLPTFRRAALAPWRNPRFAVPTGLVLFFILFSMFPWEFRETKPWDTGTKFVFYLSLAGTGFFLLLAGVYEKLAFFDRPVTRFYRWLMALDKKRFMLLTFGCTLLVSNLVSFFVFEHMPHIQDSIAQLFQARIFASGRLFIDSPRFPDFFDYTHIINNGRWYSQYPFMHSLLLLVGVLVRMPWFINPLLGGLAVPVIYLLGRELYSEQTARLGGILACLTPFIFNMSAEYMNGASTMLFATLFLVFFFRTLKQGKWSQALAAGVFLGLAANVRPYTAVAIALPFAVYGIVSTGRQEAGRRVRNFLLLAVSAGAVVSLTLLYNWLTNGHPLVFGYVVKWGPGHEIGFGKSGWGAIHTPFRGLVNTGNNMNLVNKWLFEWPIPSLLPIAWLFAGGNRKRADWLLLAGFLGLAAAYFFYWFHNVCFGPRFLYESSACLVLLTVRGGEELGSFLRRACRVNVSDERTAVFTGRVLPLLVGVMLVVGLPPLFALYHTYAGVDGRVQHAVKRAGIKNALVFCAHFGNGFSANSLALDGDIVYAKDYGFLNSALTLAYPNRRYFYANLDTLRPIPDVEFPKSRLRRALDEMAFYVRDSLGADYTSVIWPFKDIPVPGLDTTRLLFTDFREISRAVFASEKQFGDFMPAVACWMLNDGREHLRIFAFMNDLQNFLADEYKFTLLGVTSEGTAAVYDVRAATGRERTMPQQGGTVPVR